MLVFASKKEFESKADWVSARMMMIIMKSVVAVDVDVGTRSDRVWYPWCSFESRRSSSHRLHVQHPNVWWLVWRIMMAAIVLRAATLVVLVVVLVVVIHSRDDDDDDDDDDDAVTVVVVDVPNSPRRHVEGG